MTNVSSIKPGNNSIESMGIDKSLEDLANESIVNEHDSINRDLLKPYNAFKKLESKMMATGSGSAVLGSASGAPLGPE